MSHTISVIIPVYNAERTLKQCIYSVLGQTYQDFEIILVDDGSIDHSFAISKGIASKDKRLKIIHQTNQGSFTARKNGLAVSSGDYVTFLDADDYLPKTALERLYAQTHGRADVIVVGPYISLYGLIRIRGWRAPCFRIDKPKPVDKESFIKNYYWSWFGVTDVPVCFSGKLFPSDYIQKAFESISDDSIRFWGDDLRVTLIAMPLADRVVFVPNTVYYYRVGGGTSSYHEAMLTDYLSNYHFKLNHAKGFDIPHDIQLLCDIEMCNVIHSFLITQKEIENYSRKQLEESARNILINHEIKKIISNPKLRDEDSQIIAHIISQDVKLIVDDLYHENDLREKIVRGMKRLLRKLK